MTDLAEMRSHYERGEEQERLTGGPAGELEFERTREIALRHLPPPPAVVADIGGGPGAYALWLASLGYEVIHRDVVPLHVEQLRQAADGNPLIRTAVGDARELDLPGGSVDAVLLLGPLYHLEKRQDRLRALTSARRVLRPGGPLVAAAISRWAPRMDGLLRHRMDRTFPEMKEQMPSIERTGVLPPFGPGIFTAYLHRPAQLRSELAAAGFEVAGLLSVEGPAFLLSDLAERLADDEGRRIVMDAARALEQVPELLGIGPHLLAVGRKPDLLCNTMRSRLASWLVITVAAATLTGACTKSPSHASGLPALGPGAGPGSGVVEWLADPTAETATDDVRTVLKDAFEQAYPSITIKLMTGPTSTDSLRSALIGQLSSGDSVPDVYNGDVVWPYYFAAKGYALPLSRYLPASYWKTFEAPGAADVGTTMVNDMRYHGAYYGIPEFVDEGFLYYRKDLLVRAGLRPPRTWEELEKDALILKHDGLPYQFAWTGGNNEGLTCVWYEFMADALGGLPAGASLAADLRSPQSLKALDFLRGLIAKGISPRDMDTFEDTDVENAFDSGKVAFMRSWDSAYADATQSLRPGKVGMELPPTFQGEAGHGWSTLGGWGLFINPRTKNLRAALTFATWMAGREAQRILAAQYSKIPASAAVRESPAMMARSPVLRAASDASVVSRPAAAVDYPRISKYISGSVYAALPGPGSAGEDPATALAVASAKLSSRDRP